MSNKANASCQRDSLENANLSLMEFKYVYFI